VLRAGCAGWVTGQAMVLALARACTTTLGFYAQGYFWIPYGHVMRLRFDATQAPSTKSPQDQEQREPGKVVFPDWIANPERLPSRGRRAAIEMRESDCRQPLA